MRPPKIKLVLKCLCIIPIILFAASKIDWQENLEPLAVTSNSKDFVTKYRIVNVENQSFKTQDFSNRFKNAKNHNLTNLKFVLYYTSCAFGCWGPRKTEVIGNCLFTANKRFVKINEFDALLFHVGQQWKPEKKWQVPAIRSPHQSYIMYTHEAPVRLPFQNFENFHDFFNLTMTHRIDSDIQFRYGRVKIRQTKKDVLGLGYSPRWMDPPDNYTNSEFLGWTKYKNKTAAWIVSNCNDVPSQRQLLVKQLQKYIDVDIYGKCGIHCPHFPKRCIYFSGYWFYFAFENSICPDYVTEKIYGKIAQNLVLVVFNGADMSKLLPPHSYIDANDFETAEELAKYLIYLTKHPEEYIKYFWWKKHYLIHGWSRIDKERICEAVSRPSIDYKRQHYENMTAWFHKGCTDPKIKF